MSGQSCKKSGVSQSFFQFDRYLVTTLVVLGLALLADIVWFPSKWQAAFDESYVELAFLSVLLLHFNHSRTCATETNARLFWTIMMFGFGAWLATAVGSFALRDIESVTSQLNVDTLFMVYYAAIVVAIELRLDQFNDPRWLQRRSINASGGLLLVFATFGYFGIVPAFVGSGDYLVPNLLHATIDGYLAIRFLASSSTARNTSWRFLYAGFGVVFLLISCADFLSWSFEQGILTYVPGHWINTTWYIWYPVAVIVSRIRSGKTEPVSDRQETHGINLATNGLLAFGLALPLVHAVGYGADWFDVEIRQSRDFFVGIWIIFNIGILFTIYNVIRRKVELLDDRRADAEKNAEKIERRLDRELRIRSLGRLSAGLAHDFGNSVSAIAMHAKAIDNNSSKNLPLTEQISGLNQAVKYAQDLVTKLSLFGGSRDAAIVESFDINDEVEKTIQILRPSLANGVSLHYQRISESLLIKAERSMVHQVLTNYVYNAIDAIGKNGRIDVAAGVKNADAVCASCGERVAGSFVTVTVTDTGDGIDAALLDNIFEPLISSKPIGVGSGLGLSTVDGIMHKIGGHVGVITNGGEGTCFSAYFPCDVDVGK